MSISLPSLLMLLLTLSQHIYLPQADMALKTERDFSNLYRYNLNNMLKIMDEEVEPCDDFFQHACGNYENYMAGTYAIDGTDEAAGVEADAEMNVPPFLYNQEDRMHFFEENHHNFATATGKMLSNLYTACKERHHYDVLRGAPPSQWQQMLREIPYLAQNAASYRYWPLLHYQWQSLSRDLELDWVELSAELAAHGIPALMNIFFAEGTIFVAPLSMHELQCHSLEAITASLGPRLQQRSPQIADVIGNELWTFCRELTAVLPPNVVETNADNEDDASLDIFVDSMLGGYFGHFFAVLNFSEDALATARKLPLDVAKLAASLTVLRTTPPRIIYNFVLWRAYMELSYEDCYLLTEEFEQLLYAEYWHWAPFEPHFRREVALANYLLHTRRFQQHRKNVLMSEDWHKFLLAQPERKDFNIERQLKSYASRHLSSQNLARIYEAVSAADSSTHFYASLLTMRQCRLRSSFFEPTTTTEDTEDVNQPASFLRQFLYFSIMTLKQPLFHYFATQAFDAWQASQLLQSTDGFYTALDCLARQSMLYAADAEPLFAELSESEVALVFHFYRAFHEISRDYQFWLAGESFAFAEDFVLEYFNMSSERVMFYAVAQQHCGRQDALYSKLINRSFMNMPEFQEAFNCSAEALMNPAAKCMIRKCDLR